MRQVLCIFMNYFFVSRAHILKVYPLFSKKIYLIVIKNHCINKFSSKLRQKKACRRRNILGWKPDDGGKRKKCSLIPAIVLRISLNGCLYIYQADNEIRLIRALTVFFWWSVHRFYRLPCFLQSHDGKTIVTGTVCSSIIVLFSLFMDCRQIQKLKFGKRTKHKTIKRV